MLHRHWQLRGSLCLALGQLAGRRCRRCLFLVGVLPALLTLWIRSSIPESEKWKQINEQRKTVRETQRTGAELPARGAQPHAVYRRGFVRECGEPTAHYDSARSIARDHACLVEHLDVAAAICRQPAAAAAGRVRRDGLQFLRYPRLCLL
jgi:hypothetical protein